MLNVIARNLSEKNLTKLAPPTGKYHKWGDFTFFVRDFAGTHCVAIANYAQAAVGTFDLVAVDSLNS